MPFMVKTWTTPDTRYANVIIIKAWIHNETAAAQLIVEPGPKPDSGPRPWVLNQTHLRSLLALWFCTLEERMRVTKGMSDALYGGDYSQPQLCKAYYWAFNT